jgi:arabinofuranan 3-O-arabinosyltransferase
MAAAAPLLGYSAENPPLALMVVALAAGAVVLSACVGGRAAGRRGLRCLLLGGGAMILTSLYWLVPALVQSAGASTGVLSAQSSWIWTEGRANLANAFWLNNSWGWNFPQYFPFAHHYDAQPLAFLKYALPAVAFLALAPFALWRRPSPSGDPSLWHRASPEGDPRPAEAAVTAPAQRDSDGWTPRRLAVPIAMPVLLIILLSTGTNFPGSLLFNPLYHLPFGWLLREPGRFLTVAALGYAILVAATVDQVRASLYRRAHRRHIPRMRRWRPTWGAALATLAICAVTAGPGYPIVAGAAVPDRRPLLPPEHVTLPAYWQDMVSAIDVAPQSGAVAVLPPDDFYQVPYTWGYYGSDSFLPQMVRRPVVAPVPQGYLNSSGQLLASVDRLATSLLAHDWAEVHQTLGTLRSPLLLVRLDVDRTSRLGASIISPADLAAAAAADPDLHLQHAAGALRLYALNGPVPPRQEVVRQVVTVDSPTPDLATLALLPAGTHLVSGPPQAGLPVSVPVPDVANWPLQGANETVDVPEPPGWTYRVQTYSVGSSPPGQPGATPAAATVTTTPLGNGVTRLSIAAGDSLITDGDFADGKPWGPVGDCDNVLGTAAGVSQQVGPFGPGGGPALALSTRYDSACAQQRLAWTGGALRLDLSVRHVSGQAARLCIYELGPNRCAPTADLPTSTTWAPYHTVVTPDPGTSSLILFLYADGNTAGQPGAPPVTRNDYAQVSVSSASPVRVAVFGDPQTPATSAASLLLLRESFSGHWVGPAGTRHVLVDGLYNGWLGALPAAATSRYGPSGTVRAAAILSLIAGLALVPLGLGGRPGRRRRPRRPNRPPEPAGADG